MPHNDVVFGILAQISIASGMEIYMPENFTEIISTYNPIGAKFITDFTDKVAFHYRYDKGLHYLKLVGPKAPKGGGFYLSPKLKEPAFILWVDAFAKGFLGRQVAVSLGASISPALQQAIDILNLNTEDAPKLLNPMFSELNVVELKDAGLVPKKKKAEKTNLYDVILASAPKKKTTTKTTKTKTVAKPKPKLKKAGNAK